MKQRSYIASLATTTIPQGLSNVKRLPVYQSDQETYEWIMLPYCTIPCLSTHCFALLGYYKKKKRYSFNGGYSYNTLAIVNYSASSIMSTNFMEKILNKQKNKWMEKSNTLGWQVECWPWSWVKFIQHHYCLPAVSHPRSNSPLLGLLQSLPMSTYSVWPL